VPAIIIDDEEIFNLFHMFMGCLTDLEHHILWHSGGRKQKRLNMYGILETDGGIFTIEFVARDSMKLTGTSASPIIRRSF
jgi:hypothetical protein